MSRRSYLQKDWDLAKKQAAKAFENHHVTKEAEDRWLFAKQGTGIYHMRVITGPRMIGFYGDIGALMMIPSDSNAFNWLSGCLAGHGRYDPCYIAEKVPHEILVTDFHMDRVKERLAEIKEEAAEYAKDEDSVDLAERHNAFAKELEEHGEYENAHEFYDFVYRTSRRHDIHYDDGPPSVEGLTYQFFFQLEALRYFFMRFNEQSS